jgi:hypothetical protein
MLQFFHAEISRRVKESLFSRVKGFREGQVVLMAQSAL